MLATVTPTRMELLRLRKRLEVAVRGHKLLQDKLEGLVKEFMPLVEEYVSIRNEVDRRIPEVFALFARVAAEIGEEKLVTSLGQTGFEATIELHEEKRATVLVPLLQTQFKRSQPFYSLLTTPHGLDDAVAALVDLLPRVLHAAEIEEALRRLAAEIERTRRRVNALEHIFIPRVTSSIKFIQDRLEEDERAALVRSMKVKQLTEKASGGARG
jgi:V/A-type H+/Na+-transporting ATPase subunit D